jgi:hypothetical protein
MDKKIYDFFQNGKLPGSDNYCESENGPFGIMTGHRLEATRDWRQILLNIQNMGRDSWSAYGPNLQGNYADSETVLTPPESDSTDPSDTSDEDTSGTSEEEVEETPSTKAADTSGAKPSSASATPTATAIGARIASILNGE